MQAAFATLRAFNYTDSTKHLWVYKRSTSVAQFSARYAQTDDQLNRKLLSVVQGEVTRITEFSDYTYLAQTNESSCLATPVAGSDFEQLKVIVDRPEPSTESQPGQVPGWRPADPKYSTTPASKEPRAGRQLPGSSGPGGTGESPYITDGAGEAAVGEGVGAVVVGGPFAWAVAVGVAAVVWPNTVACSTMDCVPPPASSCK